jgi:predicted alpha/beta superfamily hydrolase
MQLHDGVTMNGTYGAEYHDVDSANVGDRFRIFVSRPGGPAADRRLPVVYVLDGNLYFAAVTQMYRAMTLGGEVPPAIVIGIGYPSADPVDALSKRQRDYTPSEGAEVEQLMFGMSDPTGSGPGLGGAESFARFLVEELKPALASRYDTDRQDSTLIGVSLGGLFAARILLSAPAEFRRQVLCSPSLWWNREEVWAWDQRYSELHSDLAATVFVSAGSLETAAASRLQLSRMAQAAEGPARAGLERMIATYDLHGWPRMSELTREFADRLAARGYAGLNIHCHNMPDETHTSVAPAAITRGLRYVSGSWKA